MARCCACDRMAKPRRSSPTSYSTLTSWSMARCSATRTMRKPRSGASRHDPPGHATFAAARGPVIAAGLIDAAKRFATEVEDAARRGDAAHLAELVPFGSARQAIPLDPITVTIEPLAPIGLGLSAYVTIKSSGPDARVFA